MSMNFRRDDVFLFRTGGGGGGHISSPLASFLFNPSFVTTVPTPGDNNSRGNERGFDQSFCHGSAEEIPGVCFQYRQKGP